MFVYSTCVTALIGDDIDAVCFRAAERFGMPVVPVHAPGFVGSKNLGNKLAGEALLDHVIGACEPDDVGPTDVNILGEYNLAGEFWMVKPLLEALGIRVRACITGDARYRDIAGAHTRARQHDGVLDRADQYGAQDGGALGHSLFRGLLLRRLRHLRRAATTRAPAGRRRAPTAR